MGIEPKINSYQELVLPLQLKRRGGCCQPHLTLTEVELLSRIVRNSYSWFRPLPRLHRSRSPRIVRNCTPSTTGRANSFATTATLTWTTPTLSTNGLVEHYFFAFLGLPVSCSNLLPSSLRRTPEPSSFKKPPPTPVAVGETAAVGVQS